LERTVAIKILPTSLAAESDFRQRFEREAQSVAALRHPNIVQVFDFGDVEGMYYMVIEFIAGNDLAYLMKERGPLPVEMARPLIGDIASALDYAHLQGLIHRDVKPSNVLLQPTTDVGDAGWRCILTDFGIAKMRIGGGDTKTGTMMGTLDYMAPEQINATAKVDEKADIYSLGVMLYQMLTGELPYQGDNLGMVLMAHLKEPIPDPRGFIPDLPAQIAETVMRAMAKDPNERFATAGELAQALS
jgi:serine/threonine-protein kinase